MSARDLIDESVLSDARKIDTFLAQRGEQQPSIENTLRVVRDVDTDELRRIARDVWGTGGEEGKNLVGTSFDGCTDRLHYSNRQTTEWTGDARNAYAQRVSEIIQSIDGDRNGKGGMREPAIDVGQALTGLADGWDRVFGAGTMGDVLAYVGLAVAVIGLIASVVADATVVGIPLGIVLAIISLLIAAASIWWGRHSTEEHKVDKAEEAIHEAVETTKTANKSKP